MIDTLSNKITSIIKGTKGNISEEKAEIINYGMNILIYSIFITIITFTLAILTGLLKYALVFFIVYALMRTFAGGAHARTRIECALTYLLSMFSIILLAKHMGPLNYYLAILLIIINIAAISLYAPGDTEERPVISKKIKMKQKICSLAVTAVIFAAAFIMRRFDGVMYNIALLSTIPAVFLLSPVGYRLFRCKHSCKCDTCKGK